MWAEYLTERSGGPGSKWSFTPCIRCMYLVCWELPFSTRREKAPRHWELGVLFWTAQACTKPWLDNTGTVESGNTQVPIPSACAMSHLHLLLLNEAVYKQTKLKHTTKIVAPLGWAKLFAKYLSITCYRWWPLRHHFNEDQIWSPLSLIHPDQDLDLKQSLPGRSSWLLCPSLTCLCSQHCPLGT